MGLVKRLFHATALVLASVAPVPTQAQAISRWQPYITEAAQRFGVPTEWIERVMLAESAGRTRLDGHPITSRAGAMGLMQLMPQTWGAMRRALGLGSDPYDPHDNILAGTLYLRLMYDRFGYPGLFAAYNAGPTRLTEHLARGTPLPSETRAYLVTVAGPSQREIRPPDTLFAVRRDPALAAASVPAAASPDPLFVPLSAR
uniref:lytic transglycosylase domain-containing protein n=1 Tax=uncultured Sphingomonas sp. TaxID=158754 RepID=UPI0035CC3D69